MRHMGWDYSALMAAPMDIIEEIVDQLVEQVARR